MGTMSSESFNRPGAVDLAGLAPRAAQSQSAPGAPTTVGTAANGSTGGSRPTWVTTADESSFATWVQKSVQHPVLIEFTSPRAHGSQEMSAQLDRLTDEAAGTWVLVRVDVDATPKLAQAIGIQAVPMLVAAIGGQLAPLAQGTVPEEQLRSLTEQVSQAAVASGMVGKAEPVGSQPTEAGQEPEVDPRLVEVEKLVEAGDFDAALAGYDEMLARQPNDLVLRAARAGVAALARVDASDPQALVAAAQERPDDVEAQLGAADVELLGGRTRAAFDRLIEVVRRTSDDDREKARQRLVELFEMVGSSDPEVASARRRLAAALF